MTIETFENLVNYLDENFDAISANDYQEIIWQSLGMFVLKEEPKEKTLNDLRNYYNQYGHLPVSERPLFPDIDMNEIDK